ETIAELVEAPVTGADDSFFDVGGTSLLATQLVSRLAAATGTRLEVRSVFAAPTVAELAALLDGGSTRDERPPLVAGPRPEVVPLSAAQRRLWFLNRFEGVESGAAGAYNVPVVLRLRGRLDRSALVAALRSVQRRHETLRTVFPE